MNGCFCSVRKLGVLVIPEAHRGRDGDGYTQIRAMSLTSCGGLLFLEAVSDDSGLEQRQRARQAYVLPCNARDTNGITVLLCWTG